jgi:hypothetical protein
VLRWRGAMRIWGWWNPAEHYRLAYARNKNPEIALYLAQVELDFGNLAAAQSLMAEISQRRHELSTESLSTLADVEARLSVSAPIEH